MPQSADGNVQSDISESCSKKVKEQMCLTDCVGRSLRVLTLSDACIHAFV